MIVFSIDRDAFPGITFIGWEAAVFTKPFAQLNVEQIPQGAFGMLK